MNDVTSKPLLVMGVLHPVISTSGELFTHSLRIHPLQPSMTIQPLILVAGGTGFIGGAVIANLRRHGFRTMTVSRSSPSSDVITWRDLTAGGLPAGTHGVINVTGRTIGDVKYRWDEQYRRDVIASRVASARALCKVGGAAIPVIMITVD